MAAAQLQSRDDSLDRTVNREMSNQMSKRKGGREVKGPRLAEAAAKVEVNFLRDQINSFPEELRESVRVRYTLEQSIQRRDAQQFQCQMLGQLEIYLRTQLEEQGEDPRKYKIGGFDGGTYGIELVNECLISFHLIFMFELFL